MVGTCPVLQKRFNLSRPPLCDNDATGEWNALWPNAKATLTVLSLLPPNARMIYLVGRRPAEKLRQIKESAELVRWRCAGAIKD